MNILQRTLFNRGGYAARGTGITSGLINTPKRGYVDGPGSYAGEFDSIASFPSDGAATDQTVYTSAVPTLEKLTKKNIPIVESIYGPRPDKMS